MRGKLISVAVSTALAFSLTACGGGSSSGSEEPVKQEVTVESSSISYALTSVYSGVEQSQRGSASQREVKIYTGELVSENVKTGENKTYNWSAYVNDETFEVTSNKTVVIEPGDYHFTLNLTNGSNQYISETDHTITDRNQTNIPFNLKPVLGSVITDVSVIEEIPAMKLKYDVGEISAYSQPRVAIGVDKEIQYLDINPTTGLSDVYLAIDEGDHNITLDFYDGNQYLGRSSKYPSNVTVTAKQDLNIDLVALHGEATLGFDVNESTLDVVVNIPSQVVVESEGIDNLTTLLRYSDSNVTVEKEITNLIENGEDYQGSITLEDISYGEFAFSLIFSDKSDNDELIGSCDVEPFILSENNSSVNCELSLKKRSNITGNLLATVGINVFNENMEPVAGAELYLDDDYLGLTGSGDFGTEGYLKQYIKKGNYTLKAQKDGKQGTQEVNLETLSINNFDLVLDQNEVGDFNNTIGYGKPWKYKSLDLSRNLEFDKMKVLDVNLQDELPGQGQTIAIEDKIYTFASDSTKNIFKAPTPAGRWSKVEKTIDYRLLNLAVIEDHIYSFGGDGGDNILMAHIDNPISWSQLESKAFNRYSSQVLIVGEHIYLFGGLGEDSESITRAPVTDLLKWEKINKTIFDIKAENSMIVIGEYIYSFGGTTISSKKSNAIYRAHVQDPTNWENTHETLPVPLSSSELVVVGNHMYLFGGVSEESTFISNIFTATLDAPMQWVDTGKSISSFKGKGESVITENSLYLFGGHNGIHHTKRVIEIPISK